MPQRKLQTFDHYRYGPKSVLLRGDKFRVQGGPVYVTDAGTKNPLYERGVLIFHCYCVRGAAKWIEAYRADGGGHVALWAGRTCRSPAIANVVRRPYGITRKVTEKPSEKRKCKLRKEPKQDHRPKIDCLD